MRLGALIYAKYKKSLFWAVFISRRGGTDVKFPRGTSRTVILVGRPVLVIRREDGAFDAFEALCTHLQCVVAYSEAHKQIECRCHGGVYSLEGKNVSGPPPRPLKRVAASVVQGMVTVSEA